MIKKLHSLAQPNFMPIQSTSNSDRSTASVRIDKGIATIYEDSEGNTITVPVWTYNGEYLGPTIAVAKGHTLDIEWVDVCAGQPSI